jgi:hypothetical protein
MLKYFQSICISWFCSDPRKNGRGETKKRFWIDKKITKTEFFLFLFLFFCSYSILHHDVQEQLTGEHTELDLEN